MTLLQQIQMEVVDSSSDLPSVLRKCRILAQRLDHDGFKQWVIYELEGYPNAQDVPPYRITNRALILGIFSGPFGSGINNAQIPKSAIPQQWRRRLTEVVFTQSVAAITTMFHDASQPKSGGLRVAWPAEAYSIVGQGDIFEGMNLMQAWMTVPGSELAAILNSVRAKILEFVLEVESRDPEAGEAVKEKNQIPKDQVQHIFQTTIQGDVANMAQGSHGFSQQAMVQVKNGDVEALVSAMTKLGLDQEDITELRSAVSQEPKAPAGKFGNKVTNWLGKVISKSAQGAYTISTSVAGHLITDALKKYYGL
jgi:hypothetical protein